MNFVAIDTDISGDRVTYSLAISLKISRREVVGILTLFFAGLAKFQDNGDLSGVTDEQVEDWCLWEKKRGTLAPLLRAQLCDPQGLVRMWDEWNGKMIRRAKLERERLRKYREDRVQNAERTRSRTSTVPVRDAVASVLPDLTVPNQLPQQLPTTPLSPKATDAKVNSAENRGGWPAKVADAWTRTIGIIQPGRVGKDLAPFVRLYPDPAMAERALLAAVTIYDTTCTRRSQSPKWAEFVQRIGGWVPQNQLPPAKVESKGEVAA